MIITEKVNIRASGKSYVEYKLIGYECKYNDFVEIKVCDILKNSSIKILAKCDICGFENNIMYKSYNKNFIRGGFYSCQDCSPIKRKKTCLELFGVDNYIKSDEHIQNQKIKCIEKYGVDSFFKTSDFKIKRRLSMIESYGTDHPMKSDFIKEKTKNTCLRKYGVEKFGHLNLPDKEKSEFHEYKRRCRNITNMNKKVLYENWNGMDFYDNEYIRGNLLLHYNNNDYPTIDHKTSIYIGFKNKISEYEICDIKNLCITKRILNSVKNKF